MSLDEVESMDLSNQEATRELLRALVIQNNKLEQRVKELEERLAQNSKNSSKPPSSDGPRKKLRSTDALKNPLSQRILSPPVCLKEQARRGCSFKHWPFQFYHAAFFRLLFPGVFGFRYTISALSQFLVLPDQRSG